MRQSLATLIARFPWYRPRGVIRDARAWIRERHHKREWYFSTLNSEAWIETYPGETKIYPAPPASAGPYSKHFRDAQIRHAPPAAVFFLDNAFLYSHQGAVLSSDFRVFSEFHHAFDHGPLKSASLFRFGRLAKAKSERIDETVAVLAGPETSNHYHFLLDLLPRLRLLSPWVDTIERWAIPEGLSTDKISLLSAWGVPPDKIIKLSPASLLRCRRLIVPSLPGSVGASPAWAKNAAREMMLAAAVAPKTPAPMLYVRRGAASARPVEREEELINALKPLGFEAITPGDLPIAEQIGFFAQARCVVGGHGAALANILACAPGTCLLEIFSPDYVRPEIYWTLAHDLGIRHDCLIGTPRSSEQAWGTITLDPPAVRDALKNILGPSHL
jgi:hypothetical protein